MSETDIERMILAHIKLAGLRGMTQQAISREIDLDLQWSDSRNSRVDPKDVSDALMALEARQEVKADNGTFRAAR